MHPHEQPLVVLVLQQMAQMHTHLGVDMLQTLLLDANIHFALQSFHLHAIKKRYGVDVQGSFWLCWHADGVAQGTACQTTMVTHCWVTVAFRALPAGSSRQLEPRQGPAEKQLGTALQSSQQLLVVKNDKSSFRLTKRNHQNLYFGHNCHDYKGSCPSCGAGMKRCT